MVSSILVLDFTFLGLDVIKPLVDSALTSCEGRAGFLVGSLSADHLLLGLSLPLQEFRHNHEVFTKAGLLKLGKCALLAYE